MSGHSRWATIRRKKGANDAKRSKIFTKIIKEITIATRLSGPNPEGNPRLRLAIQNAKGANMPKDTVERAINKGAGKDGTVYTEVAYEAYGPGGIALYVECTTDNINRTVANIRAIFNRHGGTLSTKGSLDFLFTRQGIFSFPKGNLNEEDFTFTMIDAGAEDVEFDDEFVTVSCPINEFGRIHKKLDELGIEPEEAGLQRIPTLRKNLDADTTRKALKLIDLIEDEDDVQKVYHNLEVDEKMMAEM
ncbi:MAG: transcriptional regulator [Bacteroidetes bacterium RIFCSPLOWO2_02_FULL_36_8]|nr:MAG: transcriptional regulator [Bacteroidetes bacterium RIFCSPLOWO2_02_FULL_36_8]OFY72162.1 MAG: transcriptional regulator [Bacteroidetes bacterium RIFCSPLOWO2_12_FULL_37_12]